MTHKQLTLKEQYEAIYFPVCDFLKRHNVYYVVHTSKEEEYRFLYDEEYSCFIEIINPNRQDCEYGIRIENDIIFIFNNSHQHFNVYEDEEIDDVVSDLLETIEDVIENRRAGYILLCDKEWLLGGSAGLDQIAAAAVDPFQSADDGITEPEFEIKLRSKGGILSYTFWNPEYDREIEIPKREYTFFYYQISKEGHHSKESFISVNDAETQNVVLISSKKSRGKHYHKHYLTITQDAVNSISEIIRNNPCVMDFDDKTLWQTEEFEYFDSNSVFNSIYLGDGTKENSIGNFDLWDHEEQSEGALRTIFDVFYAIRNILIEEGIPEKFLATYIEYPPRAQGPCVFCGGNWIDELIEESGEQL